MAGIEKILSSLGRVVSIIGWQVCNRPPSLENYLTYVSSGYVLWRYLISCHVLKITVSWPEWVPILSWVTGWVNVAGWV